MCQTQLCASSQGRGYSLKSSVRSWETNHTFSFFLVMIWRVFPQPALSSNSLGIQQIQRWHEKGSGYLQPWAPTWTHLLLLMKYFTWPPLVSSVIFWLHVHSILKIQIRSKLGPSGTAAIIRVKTPQCDSTHPTKPGGRTRQAEPVCNQVWKPQNKTKGLFWLRTFWFKSSILAQIYRPIHMGLFCGIGITRGMIFMVLFSEKCMHAVVSGSYQHSSAPSKGGKGSGWEVHDTEKRAVLINWQQSWY